VRVRLSGSRDACKCVAHVDEISVRLQIFVFITSARTTRRWCGYPTSSPAHGHAVDVRQLNVKGPLRVSL
jgi:hypothetical protein